MAALGLWLALCLAHGAPLTVAQAQERAVAQSPGLLALEAAVELAAGEALTARGIEDPELRVGRDDLGSLAGPGPLQAQLRLRTPRPWAHAAAIRAAQADVAATQAEQRAAEDLLAGLVQEWSHAWVLLGEELAWHEAAEAAATAMVTAVEQRQQQAAATTLDWLDAQDRLTGVQRDRLACARERAAVEAGLRGVLGLDAAEVLELTAPGLRAEASAAPAPAAADSPTLWAAQARAQAAQAAVAAERGGWIPWFNFVQVGMALPAAAAPSGEVTVGIEVPAFSPGTGALRAAKARATIAEQELAAARRALDAELAQLAAERELARAAWEQARQRLAQVDVRVQDTAPGADPRTQARLALHQAKAAAAEVAALRRWVAIRDALSVHGQ